MLKAMRARYVVGSVTSSLLLATTRSFSTTVPDSSSKTMVLVPPENFEAVRGLEPANLWKQFATLSSIPRPSKQEDAILKYIKDFAEERNLKWKQDKVGNLVVFHPGCGTGKEAPSVVLQGHVDMVTEKNSDTKHDFNKDPILLRRFQRNNDGKEEENWLGARGTTLGADNGIGVAAALALLEIPTTGNDDSTVNNINLPPMEALFTVDEETGLTGATELDVVALGLTGQTMLNLDTEEWGELYVGCAGGGESTIRFPLTRREEVESSADASTTTTTATTRRTTLVEIKVDGLMGGHSGINIHEGRANAIHLCAAATHAVLQLEQPAGVSAVRLVSITGGDKHNAIPREAKAILSILSSSPDAARLAVETVVQQSMRAARAEYGTLETNLRVTLKDVVDDGSDDDASSCDAVLPLEQESAIRLLSMILALPHGVLKVSHTIPDLVETSNNVASISMSSDTATILCSTRSSIHTALESARNNKLSSIASLAGAEIEKSDPYPGWNPNMQSPILQLAKSLLTKRLDKPPGVRAIHAGLECGLLIEKLGGKVDALSFGPTITGAHSPDESIHTDTVPPFFDLIKDILAELAENKRT